MINFLLFGTSGGVAVSLLSSGRWAMSLAATIFVITITFSFFFFHFYVIYFFHETAAQFKNS